MKTFANKVVWITGASSGIGRELAVQLAELGSKLILSARNVEELESLKNTLKNPEQHMVLRLDLAENGHFPELAKKVVEQYKRIDYLFNSGGISQRAEASKTAIRSEEHTSELQSRPHLVCRLLLEKKK